MRGTNPNSLSNLVTGSKKGGNHKRKTLIEKLGAYLESDLPNFITQIESLSARDTVIIKTKLHQLHATLSEKKKKEVAQTEISESTAIDWSINLASSIQKPAKSE